MDELKTVHAYDVLCKAYKMQDDDAAEVYLKPDVDAAISELKQKLEDAGMRERRLKRALYKACANWAKAYRYPSFRKFESRCLKMTEEFK